jgi:predicted nucleotide-binding protein
VFTEEASSGQRSAKLFRASLPSEAHRDAIGALVIGGYVEESVRGYRVRLRGVLVLAAEPVAARWIELCDMVLRVVAPLYLERDEVRVSPGDVFARRPVPEVSEDDVAHAATLLNDASMWGGSTPSPTTGYVATFDLTEAAAHAESLASLVSRGRLFSDAYGREDHVSVHTTSTPFAGFISTLRRAQNVCAEAAARLDTLRFRAVAEDVECAARNIDQGFSGSWFGYHARVYLDGLRPSEPGEFFDIEWGLGDAFSSNTAGDWREHSMAEVRRALLSRANVSEGDIQNLTVVAREVEQTVRPERTRAISVLHAIGEAEHSPRLATILAEIEALKLRIPLSDCLSARRPGQVATYDTRASSSQRFDSPPHLVVWFGVFEQTSVRLQCEKLTDLLSQAIEVVEAKVALRASGDTAVRRDENMATDSRNVFVVHGRNVAARDAMNAFLRALGLSPMEWEQLVHRTGVAAPYNAEVIEEAFRTAQAVVILFTGDDLARLDDGLLAEGEHPEEAGYQPRPNVLIEAGMAMQRDRGRTIIVRAGVTRHPTDFDGMNAVVFRSSAEPAFRNQLRTRLQTARCEVVDSGTDWLTAGAFATAFAQRPRVAELGTHGFPARAPVPDALPSEAAAMRRQRDIATIRGLLRYANAAAIDELVEWAPARIRHRSFWFQVAFADLWAATTTHVFDEKARSLFADLNAKWVVPLSFGKHYESIPAGYAWTPPQTLSTDVLERHECDRATAEESVRALGQCVRTLWTYLHEEYVEIDTAEAVAASWREWKEATGEIADATR